MELVEINIFLRKVIIMKIKGITECEEVVMKCIWDSQEKLALSDITAMVNEKYGRIWKPQTVSTFLSRLVKKGYLDLYRQGRYFYYTALVSQKEYKRNIITNYIHFWNNGDIDAFACDLYENQALTKDELKQLKDKINELD